MDDSTEKTCRLVGISISDPYTAKKISDFMLDFSTKLEKSAKLVHNTCPVSESTAYRKAAAGIYIEMFVTVLEPLYKKHPSLKPANWD